MFNKKYIQEDFRSSVVVFLVALPLCLGISLASGAPLLSGVVSGIIGGIVVGFISKSHTSVSGPAAGLTVIVLHAISTLGDFYSFTLAVFLAGIMQIIFSWVKAGKIGSYFPNSVIKGMLAAIGVILILKQIPHAIGFDSDYMGDESFLQFDGENTFSEVIKSFKVFNTGAVIVSILSILSMLYWDKYSKKGIKFFYLFPGALFVVLLGIFLNQVIFPQFSMLTLGQEHLVSLNVSSGFKSFFETFRMPNWQQLSNPAIFKVAITIAVVASLETLLSVEAVDKLDPHKRRTDKNKELFAQGFGNLLAGLVGALPVTSVIVRSSANIVSGGMTKRTTILHGIWLLLAVVMIPKYLEFIPLSSLAAVLILVGYKLCPPKLFKEIGSQGKEQMIPFLTTLLAILFTDLLQGIIIGVFVGFIFVIRSNIKKSVVMINDGSDYLIRFMKDISFLEKPSMIKILSEIPDNSNVIIDGSNHVYIDYDIIVIIQEFLEVCEERNINCQIERSTFALNSFFKETVQIPSV